MPELDEIEQQMERIESLYRIKQSALFIRQCLERDDSAEVEVAQQAYQDLVEHFYSETSDYVPLPQYKAAQKNYEYFLMLIDLSLAYFATEIEESEPMH